MEEVETEVENMECLEDPGVEDTENLIDEKEDDPNWHCQMEDKGDDYIDADEQYQARCYDFYWSLGTHPSFFVLKKLQHVS